MSNELALAIDFYMWLAVVALFGSGLTILAANNARLRKRLRKFEKLSDEQTKRGIGK